MCWVMPPASFSATLVLRIASSSLVLPWSTWPMTVTTGGRSALLSILILCCVAPALRSVSIVISWPRVAATSLATAAAIRWLIVARIPFFISSLIRSEDLTWILSERSLTEISSVSMTGPAGFIAAGGAAGIGGGEAGGGFGA